MSTNGRGPGPANLPSTGGSFTRLGPWCHDRRWLVLVSWIVVLFVVNGIASGVGDSYRQDFSLPDVESRDGEGSTFTVIVPIKGAPPVPDARAGSLA